MIICGFEDQDDEAGFERWIFAVIVRLQQMSSNISNKPDQTLNSPLKATSFPMNLSLFQVSQASSNNKKSSEPTEMASIRFSATKITEAQPNLFQYNDRSPLLFSSEEEDNADPHFNYPLEAKDTIPQMKVSPFSLGSHEKNEKKETVKQSESNQEEVSEENNKQLIIQELLAKQKPIKIEEPDEINKKGEQINLQKVYSVGNHSNPKNKSKTIEITLPQIPNTEIKTASKVSEPIKPLHIPQQKQKSDNMKVSKSENILSPEKNPQEHEKSMRQSSSVFSKTDEIIERMNPKKNQDILIEEQSDISSQKHPQPQIKASFPQQQAIVTVRDSIQSQGSQQRKRRNRIFDNSSMRKKSTRANVTPEKGVQTEGNPNNSFIRQEMVREHDYSPQMTALNVLNKLVDQINPHSQRIAKTSQFQQTLLNKIKKCVQELHMGLRVFNNITNINNVEDANLMRIRKQLKQQIKETKSKIPILTGLPNDEEIIEAQHRLISIFQERCDQFELIDDAVQAFIDTKYRLAHLMETSKSFMIYLKRGELKKIYRILREMGLEIETLKQRRAACGNHRLQRMLRQYLEGQISQLSDFEAEMQERVENQASKLKI